MASLEKNFDVLQLSFIEVTNFKGQKLSLEVKIKEINGIKGEKAGHSLNEHLMCYLMIKSSMCSSRHFGD